MSGKSGKCHGNPFPDALSENCQGNLAVFCNVREIWPISLTSKNGTTKLNHHFSPLCHYLFCKRYIWLKSQRSTRSLMHVIFILLAKKAFSNVIEGVNSETASIISITYSLQHLQFNVLLGGN